MKRVKSKLITTLFAAVTAFSLTACSDKPCEHTYDNACDTVCNVCDEERTTTHTPSADDGDCTTAILCSVCETVTTEAKQAHTPNADDGTCLTEITCSDCGTVTTEARTAHEGGEATCLKGKLCDFCGYEYDTVKNPENHADKIYTDNGDGTHQVACQCGELLNEREWHSDADSIDLYTGNCACGAFISMASVTVDDVTTYYREAQEAIQAACSMENSTVVLLEDESYLTENIEIDSGNFTIELNGKRFSYYQSVISGLAINGGNVVIQDSVGGEKVGYIELNSGSLTLQSGSFNLIIINSELYTPADILANGCCFYDEDGNVVNISNAEIVDGYFYIRYVTVGAIQQK